VLGMFFLGSVQLIALGIIGEYVGSIHTLVLKRPLVTEKERINFEAAPPATEAELAGNADTGSSAGGAAPWDFMQNT